MITKEYREAAYALNRALDAMDAACDAMANVGYTEEVLGETMSLHAWGTIHSLYQDYSNAAARWRRETKAAGLLSP
jgi:hypothetical protein